MTQTMKPQLPIGYWLKQVDNLPTAQIDQAQAAHGAMQGISAEEYATAVRVLQQIASNRNYSGDPLPGRLLRKRSYSNLPFPEDIYEGAE